MSQFKLNLAMIVATMVMFVATLALNELLFTRLEFAHGINWVYLPAGVRLLATLLFAHAGAIGLLLVSTLVSFFWFFPDDPVRAAAGTIISTVAPYGVYLAARHVYGLKASLANLSPRNLLECALMYAIVGPLLHHLWFAFYEHKDGLLQSYLAMFTGDLAGALIVLYSARAVLMLVPRRPGV